ncbi:MAG: hypothetical protein R3D44_07650 [Hyphomicrobiaceae bacterium]
MIRLALLTTCLAGTLALPVAAAPKETGFHTMHAIKRLGKKLCMVDHTHAGKSTPSGTGSKAVAIKLAINNWQAFTAMEYGASWGKWSNAWAKQESCSGRPGSWVCEVTARPCRSR